MRVHTISAHLRRIIVVAVIAVVVIPGLGTTVSKTPAACACISTSEYLVSQLRALEDDIQKYAQQRGGLLPTIEEVRGLTDSIPSDKITDAVDLSAETFEFTPTSEHLGMVGYRTTPDRRRYVLIAVLEVSTRTEHAFYGAAITSQEERSIEVVRLNNLRH